MEQQPRGDRPRKILVCHPSEAPALQRQIVAAGITDVLVKPDALVEAGQGYVFDTERIIGAAPRPSPHMSSYDVDLLGRLWGF